VKRSLDVTIIYYYLLLGNLFF